MRTERLDLRVYRHGMYHETWQLRDVDGNPLDITGCTMQLYFRAAAGQGPTLLTSTFDIYGPAYGLFTVTFDGAFPGVPGQSEVVRIAYDLRLTYSNGVRVVPVAGQLSIIPGVSY